MHVVEQIEEQVVSFAENWVKTPGSHVFYRSRQTLQTCLYSARKATQKARGVASHSSSCLLSTSCTERVLNTCICDLQLSKLHLKRKRIAQAAFPVMARGEPGVGVVLEAYASRETKGGSRKVRESNGVRTIRRRIMACFDRVQEHGWLGRVHAQVETSCSIFDCQPLRLEQATASLLYSVSSFVLSCSFHAHGGFASISEGTADR